MSAPNARMSGPTTTTTTTASSLRDRINGFIAGVVSGKVRVKDEGDGYAEHGHGVAGKQKRGVEVVEDGMGGTVLRPRGQVQWYAYPH